jgi:hypothetical protein
MKSGFFEYSDGHKFWYLNGKYHREDGPAIEWPDGAKSWYIDGQYHREDGPAIEYADRSKEWFLNGERIFLETKSADPKVKKLQEFMKLQEILEK